MAPMKALTLAAADRLAAIRECQRDDLLAELGWLQSMRDSLSYEEFANDWRNVAAASFIAAKVRKIVAMVAPNASAAQSFHDAGGETLNDLRSPAVTGDLWNIMGEAERLHREVLWRERFMSRHALLQDYHASRMAVRKATKAERHAITCPNRHAHLPTPAKDAAIAMLRDLFGELALLGVTAIAMYGSVARGDDMPDSDLDVAVAIAADDNFALRLRIGELIEVHSGRHVDLAYLPLRHPLDKTATNDLVTVA